MKKIYIIIDCCSGGDYYNDNANILFVGTDLTEAKQFFDNEIKNWESKMTNYASDSEEGHREIKLVYECTDFYSDSHRIMKLIEKEI